MVLQTIDLTDKNPKLKQAIERKQFLMRGVAQHNIPQEELDAELPALNEYIDKCRLKVLRECRDYLCSETTQIKKDIPTDGDMKRAVARVLIDLLKDTCSPDEIRGIMRQGYKIMRSQG